MILTLSILFILNLSSLATFCYLLLKKKHEFDKIKKQLQRAIQELHALCHGAVGIGDRIASIEKQAQKIINQPKETVPPVLDGNHYNQARKLFELGASMDDVIRSCHLSKEEAELVAMLSNTTRSLTVS